MGFHGIDWAGQGQVMQLIAVGATAEKAQIPVRRKKHAKKRVSNRRTAGRCEWRGQKSGIARHPGRKWSRPNWKASAKGGAPPTFPGSSHREPGGMVMKTGFCSRQKLVENLVLQGTGKCTLLSPRVAPAAQEKHRESGMKKRGLCRAFPRQCPLDLAASVP